MRLIAIFLLAGLVTFQVTLAKFIDLELHVAGGQEVTPHSLPWQVVIWDQKGEYICSGALISENLVLTAGHCVHGRPYVTVFAGAHNVNMMNSQVRPVRVHNIVVHEHYNVYPRKNDIAILLLDLGLGQYIDGKVIDTIRLPESSDKSESFSGLNAMMAGWDKTKARSSLTPSVLLAVNTTVMENHDCMKYFPKTFDGSHQFCAKTSVAEKEGACFDDSGSPLTVERSDGQKTVIGIESRTSDHNCASGGIVVYTRISAFLDWIQDIMSRTA